MSEEGQDATRFQTMPSAPHPIGKWRGVRKGGAMMTKEIMQEIIKNIRKALDEVVTNLRGKGVGNRKWTHDCLMRLAVLGKDDGYGVCPYPESMRGEWLYDLIWYSEEESEWPKRLKDVVLVLESEWSTSLGEIRYDFQNLFRQSLG